MRVLQSLFLLVFLTNCASLGDDLKELRAKQPAGDNFNQFLASEYLAYAESLAEEGRPIRADHYAQKGLAALAGKAVEPEMHSDMVESRRDLLAVLTADIKDIVPSKAAHTQLLFDCSVEKRRLCKDSFAEALAELQFVADALVHGEGNRFTVRFAKGSAALSSEAATILDIIGKRVASYGDYQVALIPPLKAHKMKAQRLLALEKGLIARGVNAGRIVTRKPHDAKEVVLSVDRGKNAGDTVEIMIQSYGASTEAAAK